MSTVIITEKKINTQEKTQQKKNQKFQNESTRDSKITNSINNFLCYTKQQYRKKNKEITFLKNDNI